jgi:hypothetical protein
MEPLDALTLAAINEVGARRASDPSKDFFAHAVELLAAYKRAKAENDERFMGERDDARAERDVALTNLARLTIENENLRRRLAERVTLHEQHIADIAEVRTQLKATILLSDALHNERDELAAKLAEARAQASLAWDKYDVAQTDWRLRVVEVAAERDELAAEVAAYQGRAEGALNEHWAWGDEQIGEGWIRRLDGEVVLFADHSDWRVWRYTGISDLLDVNEWGNEEGFLGNMRAAEAAARKLGWLPKEAS